jgi:hypothetical protein
VLSAQNVEYGGDAMPSLAIPTFLEMPKLAWVRCESHRRLPNDEVACAVRRVSGDDAVVIAIAHYFDERRSSLRATWVANIADGALVDFPSGERLAVPSEVVTE